jgi:hypothetical protein
MIIIVGIIIIVIIMIIVIINIIIIIININIYVYIYIYLWGKICRIEHWAPPCPRSLTSHDAPFLQQCKTRFALGAVGAPVAFQTSPRWTAPFGPGWIALNQPTEHLRPLELVCKPLYTTIDIWYMMIYAFVWKLWEKNSRLIIILPLKRQFWHFEHETLNFQLSKMGMWGMWCWA